MKPIPLQTEEEMHMVKEYLLLPIILDVLERDIKKLDNVSLAMLVIYIKYFQKVQEAILKDLHDLRTKLRKHGIQVYAQKRTKTCLEAEYLCRGYRHKFSMLWGLVKAEVKKKLSAYMDVDWIGEGASE